MFFKILKELSVTKQVQKNTYLDKLTTKFATKQNDYKFCDLNNKLKLSNRKLWWHTPIKFNGVHPPCIKADFITLLMLVNKSNRVCCFKIPNNIIFN